MNLHLQRTKAMLWELCRTSAKDLAFRLFGVVGFIWIAIGFCRATEISLPEMTVLAGVFVIMMMISSLSSAMWWMELDRHSSGFSFRLGFTRPVSTRMLVFIPMLFTIVTCVVSYIATASFAGYMGGFTIPVYGPAMLVAVVSAWLMAASWSPTTLAGKCVSLLSLLFVIFVAAAFRSHLVVGKEPMFMATGRPEFYPTGFEAIVVIPLLILAAFGVTLYCVGRQRGGDRLAIEDFGSRILAWFGKDRAANPAEALGRATSATSHGAFASRFLAQGWFEARRFGLRILLTGCAVPLVILVLASLPGFDRDVYVWLLAIFLAPVVYQFVGTDGALGLRIKQGSVQFPKFPATRPLNNLQLIAIKLLAVAAYTFAAWLILLAVAAIHTSIAENGEGWSKLRAIGQLLVGDVPWYWWLLAVVAIVLTYICSTCALFTIGFWLPLYPRQFFAVMVYSYVHFVLVFLAKQNEWQLERLWIASGYVTALAIVCLVAFITWKAVKSGSVPRSWFVVATGVWLVYMSLLLFMWTRAEVSVDVPPVVFALIGAALCFPLGAVFAAPLALASHRHA